MSAAPPAPSLHNVTKVCADHAAACSRDNHVYMRASANHHLFKIPPVTFPITQATSKKAESSNPRAPTLPLAALCNLYTV